jgi:hypothetical protein
MNTDCCAGAPPHFGKVTGARITGILCSLGAVIIAAALLFLFNPAQGGFYPVCIFHRSTGLLCPGCGSLRAMHQLLHGHVAAAMHFNVLLVFSLPMVGWFGGRFLIARFKQQPASINIPPAALWCGLVVLVLFGVMRNMPFAQVAWLAP